MYPYVFISVWQVNHYNFKFQGNTIDRKRKDTPLTAQLAVEWHGTMRGTTTGNTSLHCASVATTTRPERSQNGYFFETLLRYQWLTDCIKPEGWGSYEKVCKSGRDKGCCWWKRPQVYHRVDMTIPCLSGKGQVD